MIAFCFTNLLVATTLMVSLTAGGLDCKIMVLEVLPLLFAPGKFRVYIGGKIDCFLRLLHGFSPPKPVQLIITYHSHK